MGIREKIAWGIVCALIVFITIDFFSDRRRERRIAEIEFEHEIFKHLREARGLIHGRTAGYKVCVEEKMMNVKENGKIVKKPVKTSYLCGRNVLITAFSKEKKEFKVVKLTEEEKEADGFSLKENKKFSIKYPSEYVIMATKKAEQIFDGSIREVVYTPYSKELDLRPVRLKGHSYLKLLIEGARKDLKNRRVYSRAFKDSFVGGLDFVEDAVIYSIIENIGYKDLKEKRSRAAVRRVLTKFGLNEEEEFRDVVSEDGATGLFQITPNNYDTIKRLYYGAGLSSDFLDGMYDPKNAAKTVLCVIDYNLSILIMNNVEFLRKNTQNLGQLLAASYNCGPFCLKKRIDSYGENWEKNLPEETRNYVEKYVEVKNLLYPPLKDKS